MAAEKGTESNDLFAISDDSVADPVSESSSKAYLLDLAWRLGVTYMDHEPDHITAV